MTTDITKKPMTIKFAGNRAAESFIRPAPFYTCGTILKYGFNLAKATFELKLEAQESTKDHAPTVIFVPPLHFPREQMKVIVSGGKWDYEEQTGFLKWWHNEGEQSIKIIGVKLSSTEVERDNLPLQWCDKVCCLM